MRTGRRRIVGVAGAWLSALAFGGAVAAEAEAPRVTVTPNSPGWITVYWEHDGDGVLYYYVQREDLDPARRWENPSPIGQFTDVDLQPGTTYRYRACAVYESGEVACSSFLPGTTLAAAGPLPGMAPPRDISLQAAPDSITVSWGATGEYAKILVRLEDDAGHSDQRDVRNVPNASFSFSRLRPEARYRVVLKGCSKTLLGSSCGPWSREAFATTPSRTPRPAPFEMTSEHSEKWVRFRNPGIEGEGGVSWRIDYCLRWGADCGQPAADAFCQLTYGPMPIASSFEILQDVGPTRILSTGEICEMPECDSFAEITCEAPRNESVVVRSPALEDPAAVMAPTADVVGKRHLPPVSAVLGGGAASRDCASGFVWRAARAEDLVCVPPEARARTARENAEAASHVDAAGAYGPSSCASGYVWRAAFPGDLVCVTPQVRALVQEENRLGPSRRVAR